MINPEPYKPIAEYCRVRIEIGHLTPEATVELRAVITLCDGLNQQQAMITKALFPQTMESQVEAWEQSVKDNPPKRVF